MRKNHFIRYGAKGLGFLLAFLIAFSFASCGQAGTPGGGSGADVTGSSDVVSNDDLAAELSAKYAADSPYEYLPAIPPVERNHRFQYQMDFNPMDLGYENIVELVNVYADPEFLIPVSLGLDVEKNDDGTFITDIKPGSDAALAIFNKVSAGIGSYEAVTDNPDDEFYINYLGRNNDWGNLPRYYLVQYVDMQTGEELEKPLVQVFEVAAELPAPDSRFFVNEEGLASLSWVPVNGAERYIVIETLVNDSEEYKYLNFTNATVRAVLDAGVTEWSAEDNIRFETAANFEERGGFLLEGEEVDEEAGGVINRNNSTSIGVVAFEN
jgi:hypothetical protein